MLVHGLTCAFTPAPCSLQRPCSMLHAHAPRSLRHVHESRTRYHVRALHRHLHVPLPSRHMCSSCSVVPTGGSCGPSPLGRQPSLGRVAVRRPSGTLKAVAKTERAGSAFRGLEFDSLPSSGGSPTFSQAEAHRIQQRLETAGRGRIAEPRRPPSPDRLLSPGGTSSSEN